MTKALLLKLPKTGKCFFFGQRFQSTGVRTGEVSGIDLLYYVP
jgi:hypothetical protein